MQQKWKKRFWSIGKAIAGFFLSLFVLSVVVFALSRFAPGDPLRSYYGDSAERLTTEQRIAAEEKLGLNRSLPEQYLSWLKHALSGDLGISFRYKRPVAEVLAGAWGNTALLGGLSYFLTFAFALPLGIWCACHEHSPGDRIIRRIGTVIGSIPSFWMALVFLLLFCVTLGWLPTSGAYSVGGGGFVDRFRHLLLPLSVLLFSHLWYYAYLVRGSMAQELRKPYVLLCRAKGLPRRKIIWKHCLRGILPSYFRLMAASVPHILAGTYVVEQVFSYPGFGSLCFESAKYHDYNTLMTVSLLTGALVLLANSAAKQLSQLADPRLKDTEGET